MQDGLRIMEEACKAVEDRITGIGGAFNFHMKPKVVTATDEADLAKQLERAEQENAEVRLIFAKAHSLYLKLIKDFVCQNRNIM